MEHRRRVQGAVLTRAAPSAFWPGLLGLGRLGRLGLPRLYKRIYMRQAVLVLQHPGDARRRYVGKEVGIGQLGFGKRRLGLVVHRRLKFLLRAEAAEHGQVKIRKVR